MKKYLFETKGQKKVLQGINIAANCVSPTLGVVGKKALLDAGHLDPIVADDGAKILNMIDLENRWEQMGNRLMRKIVNKMHHKAGSGRTTSAVLARAFCNEAYKEIKKGVDKREVVERLENGLIKTLELLSMPSLKYEVREEDIKRLALTESLDEDVANIIAQTVIQ
jgi:chaperonin GroEL (HSP60 family)